MSTKNWIRKFIKSKGIELRKINSNLKIYSAPSKLKDFTFHPTPIANYYLPKNNENDNIAFFMKRGSLFEPEVIEIARKNIKAGTGVIDIGANFGQMTLEFARLAGSNGRVFSFEAQKNVFEVLTKNIEANPDRNVTAYYNAVYNKAGETLFFPDPDFEKFSTLGCFGLDPKSQKGTAIETVTIDSLNITTPISFMKVDVQGSDLFAMQGAVETIKKNQMPILFEFEQQFQEQFETTFQDYVDFVNSINYKFATTVNLTNYLIVPK
jgi:FkbM family methyltransferase